MTRPAALAAALILLFISAPAQAGGLTFEKYETGLQKAAEEQKYLMFFFWADWCPACTSMREEVFADNETVREAFDRSFVGVSIDIQQKDDDPEGLARKYRVTALPTLVFVGDGQQQPLFWRGAVGPENFVKILDYVKEKFGSGNNSD